MWQELAKVNYISDLRFFIINLSIFAVSIMMLFGVIFRKLKHKMNKEIEFHEIIDRFESGVAHL